MTLIYRIVALSLMVLGLFGLLWGIANTHQPVILFGGAGCVGLSTVIFCLAAILDRLGEGAAERQLPEHRA